MVKIIVTLLALIIIGLIIIGVVFCLSEGKRGGETYIKTLQRTRQKANEARKMIETKHKDLLKAIQK
jgi:uncharacterized protein YxeA